MLYLLTAFVHESHKNTIRLCRDNKTVPKSSFKNNSQACTKAQRLFVQGLLRQTAHSRKTILHLVFDADVVTYVAMLSTVANWKMATLVKHKSVSSRARGGCGKLPEYVQWKAHRIWVGFIRRSHESHLDSSRMILSGENYDLTVG